MAILGSIVKVVESLVVLVGQVNAPVDDCIGDRSLRGDVLEMMTMVVMVLVMIMTKMMMNGDDIM
jgi:hypothetical protein